MQRRPVRENMMHKCIIVKIEEAKKAI